MSRVDQRKGYAELKIVFYGPAQSGKTTNLLRLHERLPVDRRGDLMMLNSRDDRTLFFDLLRLTYRACEFELQLGGRHGLSEDVFIRDLGLAA